MLARALTPLPLAGRPVPRSFTARAAAPPRGEAPPPPGSQTDRSAALIDLFERASTPMGTLQRAEAALAATQAMTSSFPAPKAPLKQPSAAKSSPAQARCAAARARRPAPRALRALLRASPETHSSLLQRLQRLHTHSPQHLLAHFTHHTRPEQPWQRLLGLDAPSVLRAPARAPPPACQGSRQPGG